MRERYRFGLLGHKIGYSKSSAIFSIIGRIRNLAIDFETVDRAPGDLQNAMGALSKLDGFSVTIPHKVAIMSYVEALTDEARTIGAVNSVSVSGGRMQGFNTDATGFAVPLSRVGFTGGRALVLGTGGAARAVVYALVTYFQMTEIALCGRSSGKASEVASQLATRLEAPGTIHSLSYNNIEVAAPYDLVVNCTPVGGPAIPDRSPLPDEFAFAGSPLCYDLIYDPEKTVFISRAEKNGCRTIGGLSMLVRQAVESYTIWTEDRIDRDAVSRNALAELRNARKG